MNPMNGSIWEGRIVRNRNYQAVKYSNNTKQIGKKCKTTENNGKQWKTIPLSWFTSCWGVRIRVSVSCCLSFIAAERVFSPIQMVKYHTPMGIYPCACLGKCFAMLIGLFTCLCVCVCVLKEAGSIQYIQPTSQPASQAARQLASR